MSVPQDRMTKQFLALTSRLRITYGATVSSPARIAANPAVVMDKGKSRRIFTRTIVRESIGEAVVIGQTLTSCTLTIDPQDRDA